MYGRRRRGSVSVTATGSNSQDSRAAWERDRAGLTLCMGPALTGRDLDRDAVGHDEEGVPDRHDALLRLAHDHAPEVLHRVHDRHAEPGDCECLAGGSRLVGSLIHHACETAGSCHGESRLVGSLIHGTVGMHGT